MKKVVLAFLFILLSTFSFVSAASPSYGFSDGLGHGMRQLIDLIEGLVRPITEVLFGSADYLFEKVMFMLILISVINVAIGQIKIFKDEGNKSQKAIRWIITLSISLISVRFLVETDLIKAMMLPYGVLGVVMTSVLPFIIYFFFVQGIFPYGDNSHGFRVGRKMMWIFFAVVFVGVWGSRSEDLGDLAWIYFFTAIASLIFFLFDGTINRAILKARYEDLKRDKIEGYIVEERKRLDKLEEDYGKRYYTDAQYEKLKRKILKHLKRLEKER